MRKSSVTSCLQPVSQLALHGLQGLPVKPNAGYEWLCDDAGLKAFSQYPHADQSFTDKIIDRCSFFDLMQKTPVVLDDIEIRNSHLSQFFHYPRLDLPFLHRTEISQIQNNNNSQV